MFHSITDRYRFQIYATQEGRGQVWLPHGILLLSLDFLEDLSSNSFARTRELWLPFSLCLTTLPERVVLGLGAAPGAEPLRYAHAEPRLCGLPMQSRAVAACVCRATLLRPAYAEPRRCGRAAASYSGESVQHRPA